MKTATNKFSLTIVKKIVMSITGLLMCIFLVLHLAGNFLMFFGKDMYNAYSYYLLHIPVVIAAMEIGLIFILLITWCVVRKSTSCCLMPMFLNRMGRVLILTVRIFPNDIAKCCG